MDSTDTSGGGTSPGMQGGVITEAKRSSQALTGVILIVLGLIFLVDRMGWQWGWYLSFGRLWPLLLIVAGIGTALTDRDTGTVLSRDAAGQPQTGAPPKSRRRYGDGFFLMLVGVLMLLHVNHVLYMSQSWPLFVVAGGLSMIFGRSRRGRRRSRWEGR
jgi:cell wall-active antibiotic response 4TMS protein YvqF